MLTRAELPNLRPTADSSDTRAAACASSRLSNVASLAKGPVSAASYDLEVGVRHFQHSVAPNVSHALPNRDFWEARADGVSVNSLKILARPKRFELLTPKFVVWCSIQLSYGRAGIETGAGSTFRGAAV